MSQLLGRQDCIKSLRKDLVDTQGAVLDVLSRTGPVRSSSWKFPDKLSCDLDIVALLEEYDFVDGEDAFNQHSHIVLLELVIDRLLLLLQSVSAYIEQQRVSSRREHAQQNGYLSVGLVVKNYWSNFVQFANKKELSKNMTKQTKTKTFFCDETVTPVSPLSSSRADFCRRSSAWSSASSFKFLPHNNVLSCPTYKTQCYPKADHHNVSCQTIESLLIPCDACHQVQSLLRNTGDALVDMCQSEGLPSSLQPLSVVVKDTVEAGHMTAGDVAQWANEQLRDMRRLAKHLKDVRGTVQPLREKLAAAEVERNRFRSHLGKTQQEFKQEVEKHQANIVQLEFSLRKAQRSLKETEKRLQDEQQQLKREALSLEGSNTKLKEKVSLQQETLQALEFEKTVLQEKVKNLQTAEEACCRLQQKIQQLETQIYDSQLLLDKESAKYQSACRQQESMHAKQKSLLERVDALDEECDELQRQLGEREEAQISLHNQLQQISEVKEQLQAQLTQQQDLCVELQKEKQVLETHVDELKKGLAEVTEQVQALRERERLLVAFPELNNCSQVQPQSTGNMLLDMELQLQANSIRINVLEQENATLHKCLEKLQQTTKKTTTREGLPSQAMSTPTEKQQNPSTQVQKSPLQGGNAAK
ncbi:coiled-coil domain-containing protein 157 [Leuresthes tenuis]|uniref:coiled-coil domain-containing protein 157 n=1 Tax=Leuresthes tenuis TaxID=355514 RepID=UPI003B5095D0